MRKGFEDEERQKTVIIQVISNTEYILNTLFPITGC